LSGDDSWYNVGFALRTPVGYRHVENRLHYCRGSVTCYRGNLLDVVNSPRAAGMTGKSRYECRS
jgi:hypothetical protein